MHVARIKIENIRGFGAGAEGVDLDLTDGGTRKLAGWTVFAGPNGAGKTTLLEAMAMTIAGISLAPAGGGRVDSRRRTRGDGRAFPPRLRGR